MLYLRFKHEVLKILIRKAASKAILPSLTKSGQENNQNIYSDWLSLLLQWLRCDRNDISRIPNWLCITFTYRFFILLHFFSCFVLTQNLLWPEATQSRVRPSLFSWDLPPLYFRRLDVTSQLSNTQHSSQLNLRVALTSSEQALIGGKKVLVHRDPTF